jgi:hypothetical protein
MVRTIRKTSVASARIRIGPLRTTRAPRRIGAAAACRGGDHDSQCGQVVMTMPTTSPRCVESMAGAAEDTDSRIWNQQETETIDLEKRGAENTGQGRLSSGPLVSSSLTQVGA